MKTPKYSDASPDYTARILAGVGDERAIPIVEVDGDTPPHVEGESYYWTTPSGNTIVDHPMSYGYPTWYHGSTRKVVVGRGYRLPELRRHTAYGITTWVICGYRRIIHGYRVEPARGWTRYGRYWLVRCPNGDFYHAIRTVSLYDSQKDAAKAVRTAVHALRERRLNQRRWEIGLSKPLRQIAVTVEDAVQAGNCRIGVNSWMSLHGVPPDTISMQADELLKIATTSRDRVMAAITAADKRMT